MNIGIFWDHRYTCAARHTGVGKHILHVTDNLIRRKDLRCTLLVASDQAQAAQDTATAREWKIPIRILSASLRLYKWRLRRIDPKAVEDLTCVYSPQELCLSTGNIPMLCTLHGFPSFQESLPTGMRNSWRYRLDRMSQRRLMRAIRQRREPIISVSKALSDEASSRFGIDPKRFKVVGNGVEQAFLDAPLAARSGPEAPLIQVGGMNSFDGAEFLCRLFPLLPQTGRKLEIVGDRHEEPWFSQLSAQPWVRLHGFLQGELLRAALSAAQALIFVPAAESFGIIGLEALALGVPVIARDVGGLKECLGDCALWLESDDPAEVIQKLRNIEEMTEETYQAWQEKGRQHALRFQWEAVADRVAAVLKDPQCV